MQEGIATTVALCYSGDVPTEVNRLGELRGKRGWSRAELARRAGVSPEYIRGLEAGNYQRPSLLYLSRIAAALGVALKELNEELAAVEEPQIVQFVGDPELEEIDVNLKAIKRLDPEALDRLKGIILAVKEKAEREAGE